ncbi:MAG TPA: hypothetical protein VM534_11480 [Thermoanaerobaculia bacterium]|nr:hypothetical protein [Thermoanaerobaculia bacterium]
MTSRDRPVFTVIFITVVAPTGAAVLIAVLLLFGVEPRLVFAPGHAVKSLLQTFGVSAPNAVGVVTTVAAWWVLILVLGFFWVRWSRRSVT